MSKADRINEPVTLGGQTRRSSCSYFVPTGRVWGARLAVVLLALVSPAASAQSILDQISPELIEQFQETLRRSSPQSEEQTRSVLDQAREAGDRKLRETSRRPNGGTGKGAREEREATPVSLLEEDFSVRIGQSVQQFGYDIFRPGVTSTGPMLGAIHESYILGIGDEIVASFHGQLSRVVRVRVDREGRVILPELPPITAAGRPYGDFVRELQALTRSSLLGTEIYVSLGSVRAVSVLVIGEVVQPGMQQLTGLSTVIDALVATGGVKKTGSLRRLRVVRGDITFWIDVYDLLFTGDFNRDVRIFDGDRIIVPPIGATVAVAGKVKRPGIYELAEGQKAIALDELLAFAGGTLRPSGNRVIQVSTDPSGREHVVERGLDSDAPVPDGDIVFVSHRENILLGSITLDGHVRLKQRRSVISAPTVRGLIGDGTLLRKNPYLLFAAIQTTDPQTRVARFVPVDLEQILQGRVDHPLKTDDTLILLGVDDIRYLASRDVQEILSRQLLPGEEMAKSDRETPTAPTAQAGGVMQSPIPGVDVARLLGVGSLGQAQPAVPGTPQAPEVKPEDVRTIAKPQIDDSNMLDRSKPIATDQAPEGKERKAPVCNGLRALATIAASARAGRYASAIRAVSSSEPSMFENRLPCPDVFHRYGDLLPFVLDYVVSLNGEVRVPGAYPILPGTSLASAIAVAGGLTREVDLTSIELTRFTVESLEGKAHVERGHLDLAKVGLDQVRLNPGDSVRFNPVFTDRDSGPVLLVGEFVRPGLYEVRRGERLSELIERAGGLTPQAYPYGAVFTRDSVRKAEREANERSANELESALITALTMGGTAGSGAAPAAAIRQLANELRTRPAVGRVVIEADPEVLRARSELDTVLQPGDRLVMPKRPNSVSVIGEVLNPGALQFGRGLEAEDYIEKAGDLRRSADESRVFVVLPNGTAQPVSLSAWNRTPVDIPPGTTIVVPRDPLPFNVFAFVSNTADIFSKLAIAAASLAVINNN